MHRLRALLPNEVAGVVVILMGLSLAVLGTQQLGLQPDGAHPGPEAVGVMLASMAVMAGVALSRTRAAPFAVMVGLAAGAALAVAVGQVDPNAAAALAATPWIALPEPWLPAFGEIRAAPMIAFLLSLIAVQATTVGSLVMLQRAADAGWTRADAPALRRGLIANGVAIAASGLAGGAAPGPSTVTLGLAIATGTLARRIVWLGVPLLVLCALCPKLVVLFVLTPGPVKAAVLFYVSGFIMAQGCQLATARLLDTRRAMVVAFGLSAGAAAAVAPLAFLAALPALASPLAFGAMVSFLANLVTLPLVTKRAERVLALDAGASATASEWAAGVARGWGLKPQTGRALERATVELAELLATRGTEEVSLSARLGEDRVELGLAWQGAPLPERGQASAEDLLGDDVQVERAMLWMATREALGFSQRATAAGQEARLVFED
jgi:xanthine permease XanP